MNLGIVLPEDRRVGRAPPNATASASTCSRGSARSFDWRASRSGSATWRGCSAGSPRPSPQLLSALERARRLGARREEVLALEFLGELDFDRGRPEPALARYHEALALAERTAPEGDLVVEVERRRAEALCALGRLGEARDGLLALPASRALHRRPPRARRRVIAWRARSPWRAVRAPRRSSAGRRQRACCARAASATNSPRPACCSGAHSDDPREARVAALPGLRALRRGRQHATDSSRRRRN